MITLPKKTDQWIKALIASVVSGFSNSILAAMGIGAANALGVKVEILNWKQMLDIGISGAFIGMLLYLKQSPVPPDSGDTNLAAFVKPPNQTNNP